MLLTPAQLAQLTDRKRSAGQIRWLRAHGYPFELGASGRPKVLESVALARLGGTVIPSEPQPDFTAIRRRA